MTMLLFHLLFLANASGFSPEQVAALIIALIAGLGGGGLIGKKVSDSKQRITVDPQPLHIKMEDHFITRREFDAFKGEIRSDVMEMKGLFRETMTKIEERDRSLTDKIERAAKTGVDGRVALWNQLRDDKEDASKHFKDQGERIAKVEAGVDIAQRFERVATEAFKKSPRA